MRQWCHNKGTCLLSDSHALSTIHATSTHVRATSTTLLRHSCSLSATMSSAISIYGILYYRQHVGGFRRCQAQLIINVPSRHRCHLSVAPLSRPVPSSLGTMTMLPPLYLNEKYIFLNYFFCSLIIQSLPT